MLDQNHIPYSTVQSFVQPYSVSHSEDENDVVDLENPQPLKSAQLPCAAAIEFLADIFEHEGGDSMSSAIEVRVSNVTRLSLLTRTTALEIIGKRTRYHT